MDANLEQFQIKYQAGQDFLERGQYRLSVETLEEAKELVNPSSQLGGEVQMFLVTAYQGVGRLDDAIAMCQELARHPHPEVRKQGQQVLYILQAPKLKRPDTWITKIPSSDTLQAENPQYLVGNPNVKPPKKSSLELEDLSQINTQDNAFIWLALGLVLLIIGGLVWWS